MSGGREKQNVNVLSQQKIDDPRTVLHWNDLLCPFYIARIEMQSSSGAALM